MMKLYLIRHGDPDYENDTITETGHKEAQALAKRMAKEGINKIYCSPLGRARATMQYTADLMNITPKIENWTAEIGLHVTMEPWGKVHIADVPGEIIHGPEIHTHENWNSISPFDHPELATATETIMRESDGFLKRLGYERDGGRFSPIRPTKDKVAIFCHSAFGLFWLSYLLGIPPTLMWSGFWPAPTSVSVVLFEERSEQWATPRCLAFGDTSHLYEAGLPQSTMGLKANLD